MRGARKGKETDISSWFNIISYNIHLTFRKDPPFFNLVKMEYIMRLYLGLDNTAALSNEIAKVEIHYVPLYDLIKRHKMILIFPRQRARSYLAFPLELA